jgi:hypothetical protein
MGVTVMGGEFIDIPFKPSKALRALPKPKKQKKDKKDVNKEAFNKAKAAHKAEIAKIKAQRSKLKQDIKKHNLLIKQAKIM